MGRDFSPKKMFLCRGGGNCCRFFSVCLTISGIQTLCQESTSSTRAMASPRRSAAAERIRERIGDEVETESLGFSGVTLVELPQSSSGSPVSRRAGARLSPASSAARRPSSRRGAASAAPASASPARRGAGVSAASPRPGPNQRTGGTSFPLSRVSGLSTARFASGGSMASTFRSRLPGLGPPSTRSLPSGGLGGGVLVQMCSHGRANVRFWVRTLQNAPTCPSCGWTRMR